MIRSEIDDAHRKEALEKKFRRLVAEWEEETAGHSSPRKLTQNRPYQQIIAMGWDVVPLMLRELQAGRGYWFAALREITGENPADESMKGRLRLISEAWLAWGRRHKHI